MNYDFMTMNFSNSIRHLERAKRVIPLASQTFSKCYTQFSVGGTPLFIERGKGGHAWDLDGNEFVDTLMALAPVNLGYANDEVDAAVFEQMKKGVVFSLPSKLEAELAEKICSLIPGAEMVRFGKNGSDATSGAVRAARAFTGRDRIVCSGYHGWQDWYIGTTLRHKGAPEATQRLTHSIQYNDSASLEALFSEYPNQIAAVILEPIGVEHPRDNFLSKVKEVAHKNGALLIFDEMITGFRIALGGAQAHFGVVADLACFGKAIANGYPISAVTGRREIMKEFEEIFFSFTFGGELASMAASLKTIAILEREPVIEHLRRHGQRWQEGYNALAQELGLEGRTSAVGYGAHHVISFITAAGEPDLTMRTIYEETMAENGVLTLGSHNVCYAHTAADTEKILTAFRAALSRIKEGITSGNLEALIKGTRVESVFRKP